MPVLESKPDVLVVGGGVAALAAAIEAARLGASVRLLDAAPRELMGGNTRHSRNFRYAHSAPTPATPDSYLEDDFRADLLRATEGLAHPVLSDLLVSESRDLPRWLADQGVALQRADDGNLPYSRRTAFFLGGGMAAVRALYDRAHALGVQVRHDAPVSALRLDGTRVRAALGGQRLMSAGAFVLANGGAHAAPDLLREHWGDAAEGFLNRGTPWGRGELLRGLLAQGAQAVGDPGLLYLVAVDARSPREDGGIVTRIRGMPLGIVVDAMGRRRHDEGADTASTRYARWGQRLAAFPGQIGWLVLDAAGLRAAPPALYPPIQAGDPLRLAQQAGIDGPKLAATLTEYNARIVQPDDPTDPSRWRTAGLEPPKSNYALPMVEPPFSAYPMRPGITFAHHGVAVDDRTRVRWRDGGYLDNGFAAGMIMAANLIPRGYVSGLAVTIGLVFGRIAGREAAAYALGGT